MKRRHPLASIANPITLLLLLSLTLILQACGGGGGGPAATYKVGGTVAGLGDTPLILQNNGSETLSLSANGSYQFSTSLNANSPYNITIHTQPDNQYCEISQGSGTVTAQDITGINITCVPTYTIGGSVTGLGSNPVVIQNNGSETLSISADGNVQFNTRLPQGEAYSVTILTQPSNYSCTVGNGSGTASQNISNIAINCGVVATGYYNTGSANVKTDNTNSTALAISDLRAMVNGNRMMLMSLGQQLLYDATITVSGDAYSGEATIYKSGARISTTPVAISGTITGGSGITGTLAGSGVGNGTFELSYAPGLLNSQPAALSRVVNAVERSYWDGAFYYRRASDTSTLIRIVDGGGLEHYDESIGGHFGGCRTEGDDMRPVVNSSLYSFNITFSACYERLRRSSYTGLATNLSPSTNPMIGDLILVVFSNGESAGFAEFLYTEY